MNLAETFTLIVPTYNRPLKLMSLLRYLARQSAAFPIVVLDSGNHESKAANAALVGELNLNIRLIAYESTITPFEKFWRGSEEVMTEFCSLCADDDIVLIDSLSPLVEFLQQHLDFNAAHGWYFTFYNAAHLGITAILYSSPSLDQDDSLLRLRDMFNRYEAVTYALYRTDIMRQVLREIQSVSSLMAHELLASALTVVSGKVARLPMFYYGRSLEPSEQYDHWHPIDFLISSPEQLFAQYSQYRLILAEWFQKNGYKGYSSGELLRLIDLMHMRYLSEYVTLDIMNYLIDEVIAGTDRKEIFQGVLPLLAPATSPVLDFLRRSRLLRKIRARFAPGFRLHHVSRFLGTTTVTTTTAGGCARKYWLYKRFLSSFAQADRARSANLLNGVIRALNAYE